MILGFVSCKPNFVVLPGYPSLPIFQLFSVTLKAKASPKVTILTLTVAHSKAMYA